MQSRTDILCYNCTDVCCELGQYHKHTACIQLLGEHTVPSTSTVAVQAGIPTAEAQRGNS